MQKLLANYLFQYKICALPNIGTLHIKTESAISILGEQKIYAPVNKISFSSDIANSESLTDYIATNKNISFEEAAYHLKNISNEILHLNESEEFLIDNVGAFTKSQNDNVVFSEIREATHFSPSVNAERVIHPNDSHSILVGDKETDRNSMTEFFTDTVIVKKDKWRLWAAALFVLSIIVIFIYCNNNTHNNFFGVAHKYEVKESNILYKNIP